MSLYIGIMSGTSLDGIDVALVDINNDNVLLVKAKTYSIKNKLKQQLISLIVNPNTDLFTLGELDVELGQFIAACINQFLHEFSISPAKIKAIGSHGQTIFHSPNSNHAFSMQIGNAHHIAHITNITTIADFRQRDIAAHGQGAPLVPIFHQAVFSSQLEDRLIINIGGISNITYLPANHKSPIIGFDTGPGNVLMDAWINKHHEKKYDAHGDWAKSGTVNKQLLTLLLNDEFFEKAIPKSTGRELFNLAWLETKINELQHPVSNVDVQATLLALTAYSIANAIKTYTPNIRQIYLCGGGAHNKALHSLLASLLPNTSVSNTNALGIDVDWVEACAFAWLAYKNMSKEKVNLTTITGADSAVILGITYWSNDNS